MLNACARRVFLVRLATMLKILADDRIPWVSELFSSFGQLILKPASAIERQDLLNVDVLLTRTITRVNAELLEGTSVSFVGTATAGIDHVDADWLEKHGITLAYAAGSNASAVTQYVLCCVAYLRKNHRLPISKTKAMVVGVGHVGTAVAQVLKEIGFEVMLNDPPRAQKEKNFLSTPLEKSGDADLICIHTPLLHSEPFPTYHLFNDALISRLKPGAVLLNAGRGSVIDEAALIKYDHLTLALDVWENEPEINLSMLKKTLIATPHIAGYSEEVKWKATFNIYQQFLKHFNLSDSHHFRRQTPMPRKDQLDLSVLHWEDKALQFYNPMNDTVKMKPLLLDNPKQIGKNFLDLRTNYSFRKDFFIAA